MPNLYGAQPKAQLRPVDLELLERQKRDAASVLSGARWLSAVEVAQEKNKAFRNRNSLANRWESEPRQARRKGLARFRLAGPD